MTGNSHRYLAVTGPVPQEHFDIASVSCAGNLRRELWELRTSRPDLRDVGRDFGDRKIGVRIGVDLGVEIRG